MVAKPITVWGTRKKANEFFDDCPSRHQKTLASAMESLLKNEFGSGGKVIDASEHGSILRLVTETRVMSCVDTTYFEGELECMRHLLMAAKTITQVMGDHHEAIIQATINSLPELPGGGWRPFDVIHMGPMLRGQAVLRLAAVVGLGIEFTEEEVQQVLKHKLGDICAAVELQLQTKEPLLTILGNSD